VSHKGLCEVLEALEKVEDVRRIFIRSGLRFDYLMSDKDGRFFDRLVKKHVSGQLKVAPEHVSGEVLRLMNKPGYAVYERFAHRFEAATKKAGKPQYLLPYYISSHPGSTISDAIELALALKKQGFVPEQVQDFYPTPGTISTCMFHTGLDPMTGKPVYVAKTPREKAMQRALLQFDQERNWPLIREALREAGREDLIGSGGLVPDETAEQRRASKGGSRKGKADGRKAAADGKPAKGGEKNAVRSRAAQHKTGETPKGGSRNSGSPKAAAKTKAANAGGRMEPRAGGIKSKNFSGKGAGR